MTEFFQRVRIATKSKPSWLMLGVGILLFAVGYVVGSTTISAGDILSFLGALLGAALTVYGSLALVDYSASEKARSSAAALGEAIRSLAISHQHFNLIQPSEVQDDKLHSLFNEVENLHDQREESLELLDILLAQNPSNDPDVVLSLLRLRRELNSGQELWSRERHIVEKREVRSPGFKVHLHKLQPSAGQIVKRANAVLESLREPSVTVGRVNATLRPLTAVATGETK